MNKRPPNQEPGTRNQEPNSSDHLGYLLTAYLFENLSPAGKSEVESHLLACEACRDQLAMLRATLGLAEAAFEDDGKTYVFETRRRQRILEAATLARFGFFNRASSAIRFRSWKELAVVAAMLVLVASVVLTQFISAGSKSSTMVWDKSESSGNRHAYGGGAAAPPQHEPIVMVTELKAAPEPSRPSEPAVSAAATINLSAGTELVRGDDANIRTDTLSAKPAYPDDPQSPTITWKAPPPAGAVAPAAAGEAVAGDDYRRYARISPAPKIVPVQPLVTANAVVAVDTAQVYAYSTNSVNAPGVQSIAGVSASGNAVQDRILADVQKPIAPTTPSTPPPSASAPAAVALSASTESLSRIKKMSDDRKPAAAESIANGKSEVTKLMDIEDGGRVNINSADAGGGGVSGATLDDVIGIGGQAATGSGGGWGGGNGTGVGTNDDDKAMGRFGARTEGGRKLMVKRHGGSISESQDAAVVPVDGKSSQYGLFPAGGGPGVAAGGEKKDTLQRGNDIPAEEPSPLEGEGRRERSERGVRGAVSSNAPKVETTTLNRGLNESRDRSLSTAKPMQQAAQNGEVDRYAKELEKVRGITIQQQQAVVVEGQEGEIRARNEKAQLENELNTLKQSYAALAQDKNEVQRDLSRQTKRVEALIEKGVPVISILQEDVTATQPEILPDPATAAARTGLSAKHEAEKRLEQLSAGQSLVNRPSITPTDKLEGRFQSAKEEVTKLGLEGLELQPAQKEITETLEPQLKRLEPEVKKLAEAVRGREELRGESTKALELAQKDVVKKYKEIPGPSTRTVRDQLSKQDALEEQLQEEEVETGRSKVAIAAKDDTIRRPEELLAKERANQEELHRANAALAVQNDQLAVQNADVAKEASIARLRLAKDLKDAYSIEYSKKVASPVENGLEPSVAEMTPSAGERNPAKSNKRGYVAAGTVVVPPDIQAKAELGDHFETINPEPQSALGNPDAPVQLGRSVSVAGAATKTPALLDKPVETKYGPNNPTPQTSTASNPVKLSGKLDAEKEALVSSFDGDVDTISGRDMSGALKGKNDSLYLESTGVQYQSLDPDVLLGDFGDVRRLGAPTGLVQPRIPGDTATVPYFGFVTPSAEGKVGTSGVDNALSYFDVDKDSTAAQKEKKDAVNTEYKHHFDLNRERAERMNIPHSDYLIYPDDWSEIARKQTATKTPTDPNVVDLKITDVQDLTGTVQDFPGPITLLRPRLDSNFPSRIDANNSQAVQKPTTGKRTFWGLPNLLPAEDNLPQMIKDRFASDFVDPATAVEQSGGKLVIYNRPAVQQKIEGYLNELRKDPVSFQRQWYSKAFASPTLVQNDGSRGQAERTLRAYNHLRAETDAGTGTAKSLSFAEFCKRPAPITPPVLTDDGLDEDAYIEKHGTRPFVDAKRDHLSTFSMDVDTASYTRARSQLRENNLPDPAAVRVEEFVNYFKQPYSVAGEEAFGVFAEAAPSPFSSGSVPSAALKSASAQIVTDAAPLQLLKIGIKSRDPKPGERKPAMLTFAIDTSGSMTRDDRLDMLRAALGALVEQLQPEDAVSIVSFADQAQVLLPRTQARQKQRILDAVAALHPDGGTNVEAGLALAYRIADESFSPDAVNRVILCSDGVANVGAKGPEAVLKTVKVFAGRGIDLSSVGFGMGKYNDEMMMKLADNGNGSCHFVDTLDEARRIFTQQLPPHLSALARDAKIQVEFNPTVVARYRLLGYEKRKIADKDFRNDAIDAGEVQHSTLVTALYEIERAPAARGPLGKVFLRWKDAGHRHLPVIERNFPLDESMQAASAESASPQLRFLACVARFAELLRNSPWTRNSSYADVLEQLDRLPVDFKQRDDCKEVRELVQRAQTLSIQEWSKNL